MPALSDVEWAAVRADWETGVHSNRALAAKYGVSEKAVRSRAQQHNQPGGAWVRQAEVMDAIHDRAAVRTIAARAAGGGPQGGPQGVRTPALARAPAREEVAADALTREQLREQLVEQASALLVEENLGHLARLDGAKQIADRLQDLLLAALTPVQEGDEHGAKVMGMAMATLLSARNDSISGHVGTLVKTLDSIQIQTRRALGAEDKAKRVELTGRNGGAIQTEGSSSVEFDPTRLDTATLERFLELADLVSESQEHAPLPMPPEAPSEEAA